MPLGEQTIAAGKGWLRWPPWLLSCAAHLAVAILGVLLVRSELPPQDIAEADRPAAIVLVKRGVGKTSYFSEDSAQQASAKVAAKNTDGLASGFAAGPLAGATPPDAGIKLPELPGGLSTGEGLVPAVAPNAGRGRPKLPFATIDEAAVLAADALVPREIVPNGPTAKMSLFGSSAAEGRSFVFVIDHSQSMGGEGLGAIAAAAKELAAQVTALGPEQTFQVVSYNQTASYFTSRELIAARDEHKAALVRFVANLVAAGPTEHERGLRAALALKPEVIFLLTDGGDPHLKPAQIRAIAELAGPRTTIHCLHFGPTKADAGASDHFLRRLAAATGGSYTFIAMSGR